jgi:hypothetical protein
MEMWPEVRANKIAREEFERVCDLLGVIGKDDALQEGVVNRYCLLRAECVDFEKKRDSFNRSLAELKREFKAARWIPACIWNRRQHAKNLIGLDRQIQSKRNMMLAIEKENLMTIASALRSIPKKVEKKSRSSGVAAFMQKRNQSG